MSTTRDLYGVARTIAATGEYNWGANTSGILEDVCTGLNNISCLLGAVPLLQLLSTSTAVTAAASITQTHMVHLVAGSGGAVTLSSVTPVVSSTYNTILILIGTDSTNSVTIPEGGTNIVLNGEMKLVNGAVIAFIFNTTQNKWIELFRNI